MSKRLRRTPAPQPPALQPPASSPDSGRSEGRPPLDAPEPGRREAGPFGPLDPAPPSTLLPGGAGPAADDADDATANAANVTGAAASAAATVATTDTVAIVGAKHSASRAGLDDTPGAECFAPTSPARMEPAASASAAAGAGNADDVDNAAKVDNANAADDARRRSFYQKFFNTDETALIAAFQRNPTPEDELWLQRIVNRRLLAKVPGEADDRRQTPQRGVSATSDEGRTPQNDSGPVTIVAPATAQTKDAPPPEDEGTEPEQRADKQAKGNKSAPAAPSPDDALKGLVLVARQLTAGAGRVAALLREVRALGLGDLEKPPQAAQAAARELGPARDWKGKP